MDERWSKGWRSYVQPWGSLEAGGGAVGVGGMAVSPHPFLWASKATPTPQEARSSSLGLQDPATLLPHCSLPCSRHTSGILLHSSTWAKPHAALEEGPAYTAPQGSPNWPSALSASSGPPSLEPRPSAQTWVLRLAAVPARWFSDLVIYRYCSPLPWGSWELHPLGAPAPPGHTA